METAEGKKVGDGATRLMHSDRQAFTIIEVRSPKCVVVQRDAARRIDSNGISESQEYEFHADPQGGTVVLRLCKRGWRAKSGEPYSLAGRSEYYDYSF